MIPARVRRGGYFGNYFGPDYLGGMFGGKVVRQAQAPGAVTSVEVIEFSEQCIAIMKRLLAVYASL